MSEDKESVRDEFDPSKKKILEEKPLSGIVVPIAIVLVGALIIFGVTKMLSSGRNHRDLVQEMRSKTFGNRWVAAYELSKLVASDSVPVEDRAWLIENLTELYDGSNDPRTKNFIIMTFGSLKHRDALPLIEKAINSKDRNIAFNAIAAAGNLPEGMSIDWSVLMEKTNDDDEGLRHAAVLALAAKRAPGAEIVLKHKLSDESVAVRYAAATALVQYQEEAALPTVREILKLESTEMFNDQQLQKLKLNLISSIGRSGWSELRPDLEEIVSNTSDLKIETTAKQALNMLKI